MRSFQFEFEERVLLRAWPVQFLISGELEVFFDGSGNWHLGSVQVKCFRHGEHLETRCMHERSARAQRIHTLMLNDALLAVRIEDEITTILESAADLAAEAKLDDRRECAA